LTIELQRAERDLEDNPFTGSRELSGLKMLAMLLNNWDAHDGFQSSRRASLRPGRKAFKASGAKRSEIDRFSKVVLAKIGQLKAAIEGERAEPCIETEPGITQP
jgi:hypothetical protein